MDGSAGVSLKISYWETVKRSAQQTKNSRGFLIVYLIGVLIAIANLASEAFHIPELTITLDVLLIFFLSIDIFVNILADQKLFFRNFWNIMDVIVWIASISSFILILTGAINSSNKQRLALLDEFFLILRYLLFVVRGALLLRHAMTQKTRAKNFSEPVKLDLSTKRDSECKPEV
jgi:hypothetical protein